MRIIEEEQILKLPYGTIKIENSIMTGVYEKGLTIDREMARTIVKERLSRFGHKKYPVLADIRGLKYATKEARDYFAKEGVEGMSALAILMGNYVTVVTANLFISFSKPLVPTRAFRTREAALKWLKQFVAY